MLAQILYISKRSENCDEAEIQKILESAIRNNPAEGATGLLLYSDTKFIQYVEGERVKILALYDKIKQDERHHDIILMSLSLIKDRVFPNWHMGGKPTSETEIDYITDITKQEKMIYDNILEGSEETGKKIQKVLEKFL